ncbi:MAG TPA: hypothetical protein VEX86_22040 [Longimicrobium sp.]|nr:hypothetical protein [Longimicrobium sp.]
MRKTLGALALVVIAAAPAGAQQHAHGQAQQHGGGEMMHPVAHAALEHRQEVGLNADQVRRLTAIDSAHTRAMRDHCARVRAAGGPSAQTHAALHGEMTALMQRSQRDAQAVLTAAQKATLDSLHAAHHPAAGQGAHAMHAKPAAHDSMHAAHHGAAGSHGAAQGQAHAAGAKHDSTHAAHHGAAASHGAAQGQSHDAAHGQAHAAGHGQAHGAAAAGGAACGHCCEHAAGHQED